MNNLHTRIQEIATVPVLLVASDFDGTLAPLVDDPAEAGADGPTLDLLKTLAALPQTEASVISGRALADLQRRIGEHRQIYLVGSHGVEWTTGLTTRLSAEAHALLNRLHQDLLRFAARADGAIVERKPASVAFHYRRVEPETAKRVLAEIFTGPAAYDGVHVAAGKKVVELSVLTMSKGRALQTLRQRLNATAILFVGDDQTDEDAFSVLTPTDIGVKVGPGTTVAPYTVDGIDGVRELLATLFDFRKQWLSQFTAAPIESYSLLSDQRCLALVSPTGRIAWMCLPRLDAPAVFAELLDSPAAGVFCVTSDDGAEPTRQRYLGDSLILETVWPSFRLVDYLDCSSGRAFQRAGRSDLIRVIEGHGSVTVTFAPRLNFARAATRLHADTDGLVVEGSPEPLVLRSPGVHWTIADDSHHQTATAHIQLNGTPVVLELCFGTQSLARTAVAETQRRGQTERFWTNWAAALTLPSVAPELVRRSALTLKALAYGPTGAIAAAATTSLPEQLGGIRNWDYRYCWPRDGALAAAALLRLGAAGPAMRFLDWLLGIVEKSTSEGLRPVYTVTGGHLTPEAELSWLHGYAASRPVRIGNAASEQVQLDVFGPIVDLVAMLAERDAALSSEHWQLVDRMVHAVEARWREPDQGIWEIRGPGRHHVHSKVMCWMCVDRGLTIARYLGHRRPEWQDLRHAIAQDILEHGWDPQCGAFTACYGLAEPDAATLWIGLSGLLDPQDSRLVSTVEWIERSLRSGPTVYRYRYGDWLPGDEGGFHICTTWLIEAYALIGRRKHAEDLFEQYAALAGPTGLLSEEFDPRENRALGNHPQAYSHLGLINAAVRLSQS